MAKMTRTEYNACVGNAMRGKQMTKEERRLEFCVVAKTCSGKVKTHEEGLEVCRRPKAPKSPKATGSTPRPSTQQVAPQGSREQTLRPASVDRDHCEMSAFSEAARMYKDLYAFVYPQQSDCGHCDTLRARILDVDIPHPIVDIPGDICSELADSFGVSAYPSIVRLKRGKVKAVHTGNPDTIIKKMMEGK